MKKLLSLIFLLLILLGGYLLIRYISHQRISKNFKIQVSPIVEQIKSFEQIDLGFLPENLDDIDIKTKKDPELAISILKTDFRTAVDQYNATRGIWTTQGLPTQLDIDRLITSMTLKQKVSQLFIFGFDGTILSPGEKSFLLERQPGGVILMGRNISPQLSQTINDMQATQDLLPLFVAIDQEGGIVTRIDEDLPGQPDVGLNELCHIYTTRSDDLHKLGINMNFGIVADSTTDDNSFIYPRVFQGDIGAKVAEAVTCTTHTLSTIKHRPGHGATALDTHLGTATLIITRSTREELHLQPFVDGISAGSDLIMMGHLIADWLDPTLPSTLSRSHHTFLDSLGFDGLTVTDDMLMISDTTTRQTHLEQALIAGNDLILYVDPNEIGKTKILDHAIQFVRDGNIDPSDLDTRVRKILGKKQKIISGDEFVPLDLIKSHTQ